MSRSVSSDDHDLIIVGAGVFGLSTALEAARRGLDVSSSTAVRCRIPTAASTGPSRKLRSTYLDDGLLAARHRGSGRAGTRSPPRPARSASSVSATSSTRSTTRHPTLDAFQAASERAGGSIERLDRADLRRRFPTFRRARTAIFEADGGVLRATAATRAIATLAVAAGARIDPGGPVVRLDRDGADPAVVLADGRRLTRPADRRRRRCLVVAVSSRSCARSSRSAARASPTCPTCRLPSTTRRSRHSPSSRRSSTASRGWGATRSRSAGISTANRPTTPTSTARRASQPFIDGVVGFLGDHFGLEVDAGRIVRATLPVRPDADDGLHHRPRAGQSVDPGRGRELRARLQVRVDHRPGRDGPARRDGERSLAAVDGLGARRGGRGHEDRRTTGRRRDGTDRHRRAGADRPRLGDRVRAGRPRGDRVWDGVGRRDRTRPWRPSTRAWPTSMPRAC